MLPAEPAAVEMEDGAVQKAAATLAETSMSEYSDISDVEEDPVEPVRLDVLPLPEGTDSGSEVAGTIGQTPSMTPILSELAQPIPLRVADILAVIRMTSTLEVSAAVTSLRRHYAVEYDAATLSDILTLMINMRQDLAGRLLEQLAELWATGATSDEILTGFANVLLQIRLERAAH